MSLPHSPSLFGFFSVDAVVRIINYHDVLSDTSVTRGQVTFLFSPCFFTPGRQLILPLFYI